MVRLTRLLVRHLAIALLALGSLVAATQAVAAANGSVTYSYDALGRLTSAAYDTGVVVIYTYDANGNRTSEVISVLNALTWSATTSPCTANCWGQSLWNPNG
ncbi:MAG: RHS repeat protein [Rhodospirillales bacterium]|nr:RHS repeat protein [Rhodospirillales bacterium]